MEETMIPGPFSYHRPATLADAVKLLSTLGDEARPLAGGHSLVPMMKLRLATPEHLVDLHGSEGLKGIRREGNRIVIGAMTTQHELLASDEIANSLPILRETAVLIADPQVRYRGTIGGNVANGDPGNDMPALMLVLGASYRLEGTGRARRVAGSARTRAGGIPQACRQNHGEAGDNARRFTRRLREAKMAKTHVTMKVNGAEVEGLVEPRALLVHFLRENLSLTGTHIGCETTHCGACTVDLDGMSVKSCTLFAAQAQR